VKEKNQTWSTIAASAVLAIVFMLPNMATPVYPYWKAKIGFSAGAMTGIFALYIAGLVVSLIISGQLADRWGHKAVLIPGLVLAAFSCLLYMDAESVMTLTFARILTGFAVGTVVTAGMASVIELGGISRIRTSSLLASIAIMFGAGIGPLMSGFVAQHLVDPVMMIYRIEMLAVVICLGFVCMLPLQKIPVPDTPLRLKLPAVYPQNNIHIALGVAVYIPDLTSVSFVAALAPTMFLHQLGSNSPLLAGAAVALTFLSASLVQPIIKGLKIRTLLSFSALICIISLGAMSTSVINHSVLTLICAGILAGISQAMAQLGAISLISQQVHASVRAQANALFSLGGYIPAGIFSGISGFVIDLAGLTNAVCLLSVLVSLLALGGGIFVWRSKSVV